MIEYLMFVGIGILIGAYGTMIGAGGGFILMPILLILFPDRSAEMLTSISLAVVFFNASSGTIAYVRMKRIDYKAAIIFAIATIPGAVLGALTISYINRVIFNYTFAMILAALSVYLFIKPTKKISPHRVHPPSHTTSVITDAKGNTYTFRYNIKIGIFLSIFVGYISSLLGLGGGIIHVPALVNLLNFPVHIATATSHFMQVIMALAGTIVHIIEGSFDKESYFITIAVAIGAIIGAQTGAILSNKVKGKWIIRGLALALLIVAVRILYINLK
ncbi:MAG: sulfite exporter TauE/SafE family protein [Ignavibacteriae bacterium]|nr:MAG: sulfite exporter TauE/SafE family protein [Ignavibacteriota bacterium]